MRKRDRNYIELRLEAWAAWLEGGAGTVAIAIYARNVPRVDYGRGDRDGRGAADAMHAETDRIVRALPINLRDIVIAMHLCSGSIIGLASCLGIDAQAFRASLAAIDAGPIQSVADQQSCSATGVAAAIRSNVAVGAPKVSDGGIIPRNRADRRKLAERRSNLRSIVSTATAMGLTEGAVRARLTEAYRRIDAELNKRRQDHDRAAA